MDDRITRQNVEFDTLRTLALTFSRLMMCPVVDDDYPEIRHEYESALLAFREALRTNRPDWFESPRKSSNEEVSRSFDYVSAVNYKRSLRWHPQGVDSWSLSDWGVALAGEVGELCNVIKKLNRYRDGMQQNAALDEDDLVKGARMEIGDVFLYLDLIARRMGWSLEQCVVDTFARVSLREGFPERL